MLHTLYQSLKVQASRMLPLANDTIHIYLGFGCYVVTVALFRLKPSSLLALLPGILISILMEVSDLRAEMLADQVPRWLNSLKDIVNTNLIPFVLVLLSRLREERGG